jgi:hypothetical protein
MVKSIRRKRLSYKVKVFAEEKQAGRAQVWSIDVMLAAIIFISVIIVFYIAINSQDSSNVKDLQADARFLKGQLEKSPDYGFISMDTINSTKMQAFADSVMGQYQRTKEKLGMRDDFCIYIEDENGNLMLLSNSSGANITGIGASEVNISGTPCGKPRN